jgi:hypothetical protein
MKTQWWLHSLALVFKSKTTLKKQGQEFSRLWLIEDQCRSILTSLELLAQDAGPEEIKQIGRILREVESLVDALQRPKDTRPWLRKFMKF